MARVLRAVWRRKARMLDISKSTNSDLSCFQTRNLFTEFTDKDVPVDAHQKIEGHLRECRSCELEYRDFQETLEALHSIPLPPLDAEVQKQWAQLARQRKQWLSLSTATQALTLLIFCSLCIIAAQRWMPSPVQSWIQMVLRLPTEQHFVRYDPLAEGALSVVQEQASWLQFREPSAQALWNEGGMSADEFERAFHFSHDASGKDTAPAAAQSD